MRRLAAALASCCPASLPCKLACSGSRLRLKRPLRLRPMGNWGLVAAGAVPGAMLRLALGVQIRAPPRRRRPPGVAAANCSPICPGSVPARRALAGTIPAKLPAAAQGGNRLSCGFANAPLQLLDAGLGASTARVKPQEGPGPADPQLGWAWPPPRRPAWRPAAWLLESGPPRPPRSQALSSALSGSTGS